MLSPKDDVSEQELVNKDIVFVLDTSGSMADEGKMEKARAASAFRHSQLCATATGSMSSALPAKST